MFCLMLIHMTFSSIDPDFLHKVLKLLHVNNLCSRDASIQSAYNFYMKCKDQLSQANFTLHKLEQNSSELE